MNFKTTVASFFIATAALLTGGEALAEKGGATLFNSLDEAGIPVSVTECEDDSRYGYFAFRKGTYGGRIQICTNVATTEAARWETLRHEAVHVAQMCRSSKFSTGDIAKNFQEGNFDTIKTMEWLETYHSRTDWNFIQEAYNEADWLIEIEAFTLQNAPNSEIARLVDNNCN